MNRLITALHQRLILIVSLTILIAVFAVALYLQKPLHTAKALPTKKLLYSNITGKHLFDTNCEGCHGLYKNHSDIFIGGLNKLAEKQLLYSFIQYPEITVASSKYLQAMQESYGGKKHPPFSSLSNAQIDSIVGYVMAVEHSRAQ